jgi:hypothetical protein
MFRGSLKESHPPWRLFPPAMVAQAPVYSYIYFIPMRKVWETTFMALRLIAAAAGIRFEPGPVSPEQIASNCGSRTPDHPELKEFLATNRKRKFFNWPASPRDFSRLTFVAGNCHPELDVAKAKHISTDTK